MMAWQRIERRSTITALIKKIEEEGPIPYTDAEKFIMNLHMLSRLTADRYINDLLLQGSLISNGKDHLDIPNRQPKPKK